MGTNSYHEVKYGHQDFYQDDYKTYQPKMKDDSEEPDGGSSKHWYDNWISSDRHHEGKEDGDDNEASEMDNESVFYPDLVYSMSKKSRDDYKNSRKISEEKSEEHEVGKLEKYERKEGDLQDKCTDYNDFVSDAFKILDDKTKESRSLYGKLRKNIEDLTMFGYCFDYMLVMEEYGMSRKGKFFNPFGLLNFKWMHVEVQKEEEHGEGGHGYAPKKQVHKQPYQPYQPQEEHYQPYQPSNDQYAPEDDPYESHVPYDKPQRVYDSSHEDYGKPHRDYEMPSNTGYEQSHDSYKPDIMNNHITLMSPLNLLISVTNSLKSLMSPLISMMSNHMTVMINPMSLMNSLANSLHMIMNQRSLANIM